MYKYEHFYIELDMNKKKIRWILWLQSRHLCTDATSRKKRNIYQMPLTKKYTDTKLHNNNFIKLI